MIINRVLYDLIRKNKYLNHIAHKIIQGEFINKNPLYAPIYTQLIHRKATQYLKIPSVIEFEITNKCNAQCIMCPPAVHMGHDFLDTNLFKRILKEAHVVGIRRMCLTGGEPLLDNDIFEKIKYVKKVGYSYVHLFTNGSLLTAAKQKELLESGLDSLTISVDSAIKEEYEAIRRNLNFDKVLRNINDMFILRKKLKLAKPIIRINMVALAENSHSRKKFINTFKNCADIVEIIDDHNWAGSRGDATYYKEYSQIKRWPCHLLFSKAVIDACGFLKKCSVDYSESTRIADMNHLSLEDALHNSLIVHIKENHLKSDFSEPGCDHCTHKESWWVNG